MYLWAVDSYVNIWLSVMSDSESRMALKYSWRYSEIAVPKGEGTLQLCACEVEYNHVDQEDQNVRAQFWWIVLRRKLCFLSKPDSTFSFPHFPHSSILNPSWDAPHPSHPISLSGTCAFHTCLNFGEQIHRKALNIERRRGECYSGHLSLQWMSKSEQDLWINLFHPAGLITGFVCICSESKVFSQKRQFSPSRIEIDTTFIVPHFFCSEFGSFLRSM